MKTPKDNEHNRQLVERERNRRCLPEILCMKKSSTRCCCSRRTCCPTRKSCGGPKRCCRRHYRFLIDIGVLHLLTFLVALPLFTFNLRHTAFDFLKHRNVTTENKRMFKENAERYTNSLNILKTLGESQFISESKVVRNLLQQHPTKRTLFHDSSLNVKTGVAITIITVTRWVDEAAAPYYLTQTVASFLRLMHENELILKENSIHLSICNVDVKPERHIEIQSLPKWIPVYTRYQNLSKKIKNLHRYKSVLNKEKDDYAYCLDKALDRNLSHVLIVEDDALPRDELFIILDTFILSSDKRSKLHDENVAFYKLYHPERLLGYISLEFERIPELLSSSALLSLVLLFIYVKVRRKVSTPPLLMWLSFFIYSCLLFLAIGRVNVLEIRRISRHLYQMTPSPSCCTPAMLFSRNGGKRISEYLKTVIDRVKFPKDAAIDEYVRKHRLVTRFIQPNLFKHIGHVSSLRPKLLDPYIV